MKRAKHEQTTVLTFSLLCFIANFCSNQIHAEKSLPFLTSRPIKKRQNLPLQLLDFRNIFPSFHLICNYQKIAPKTGASFQSRAVWRDSLSHATDKDTGHCASLSERFLQSFPALSIIFLHLLCVPFLQ